ncbi:hypothetical protein VFPPC_18135 [Pochonia chlamydosporia 170]|uniref:Uncharacterized protein n=1 Tax=Pochonia chlamydosporia 170 TaxID=1380566 RepID=A0A219AQ72_METCM|nr:hypothetical protein VFPPC_18135 [Pochonia chlamydosporia 170]OWT42722.1 hypothetical protein VFPPC_18135 [Pochonia chlamydosporia 170]
MHRCGVEPSSPIATSNFDSKIKINSSIHHQNSISIWTKKKPFAKASDTPDTSDGTTESSTDSSGWRHGDTQTLAVRIRHSRTPQKCPRCHAFPHPFTENSTNVLLGFRLHG